MILLNKTTSALEERLFELANEVMSTLPLELYDQEYLRSSKTLRVYVCNPDTYNAVIEDCIEVDRAFTPFIEDADWVPNDLVLEVSSPGVFRNLKTTQHFEKSQGELIKVKLLANGSSESVKKFGKKKYVRGVLKSHTTSSLELELNDSEVINILFKDIDRVNLDPEI